jgi:MFS family permease
LGAALGLGFGVALNFHMTNLFGPPLIAEFGWSKSQFALVGSMGLISLFFTPVAGRITDRFGARTAAIIGFSVVPLAFFSFSLMTGSIVQFYAIALVNGTLGILTATMVFTRVVVERFDTARGLALSFLLCCPPLAAAVAAPIVGSVIENDGWRAAYRVLALASACGGLAAIALIGRSSSNPSAKPQVPKMRWTEFRQLLRQPVFLLLLGGMFLCNFPQILVASQMNIMLMENGASMRFATALVSLYSICVVIGRIASGYALDRIAPHLVAIIALGLPALGYIALASSFDARWVLAGSIGLVGLAQGAETDVGAFLTSRRFDIGHFSFVFSMLMTSMGLASALGALLLSYTLYLTDSYNIFLYVAAGMTLSGALFFYLTGRHDKVVLQAEPDPAMPPTIA